MPLFTCVRTVTLATIFGLSIANIAYSVTITTATGGGADAAVLGETNQGTTNFGTGPTFEFQDFSNPVSNWLAFLKFDITPYTSGTISGATLSMIRNGGDPITTAPSFGVHGLNNILGADGWIESGAGSITYQNAPGLIFPVGFASQEVDPAKTTLLGTVLHPANGQPVSFSGAALDAFLNADTDGLVTFILANATPGYTGTGVYRSKEYLAGVDPANSPTLTFTFQEAAADVPEPSTFILAGLGLAGLGFVTWRRRAR